VLAWARKNKKSLLVAQGEWPLMGYFPSRSTYKKQGKERGAARIPRGRGKKGRPGLKTREVLQRDRKVFQNLVSDPGKEETSLAV